MPEMEIPMNVEVHSTEGPFGRSRCTILDPIDDRATHLVVEEVAFPHTQRLIPIEFVQITSPQQINLRCTPDQLTKMEPFVEEEFIPLGPPLAGVLMWPYVEPESGFITLEHERIPAGEIVVRRGTRVEASDGPIGRVDELMIDRKTKTVSHLVLREGHLWGRKDISIPVAQIRSLDADGIVLRLSRKEVEALPEIKIRRRDR